MYIDREGYLIFNESRYKGDPITAQVIAVTPFREPVYITIKVSVRVILNRSCVSQTVSTTNTDPDD